MVRVWLVVIAGGAVGLEALDVGGFIGSALDVIAITCTHLAVAAPPSPLPCTLTRSQTT